MVLLWDAKLYGPRQGHHMALSPGQPHKAYLEKPEKTGAPPRLHISGYMLGSRRRVWGVQPLWMGLTFCRSPRICDIPGNLSGMNRPPLFFFQLQQWDFTKLTTSRTGAWAWMMGTLQMFTHPGALASLLPTSGELSWGAVSHRRWERLGGFGARACSYSDAEVNFICTQSQHVGGLEAGTDPPWRDILPARDSAGFLSVGCRNLFDS